MYLMRTGPSTLTKRKRGRCFSFSRFSSLVTLVVTQWLCQPTVARCTSLSIESKTTDGSGSLLGRGEGYALAFLRCSCTKPHCLTKKSATLCLPELVAILT